LANANSQFNALPSDLRNKFGGNPANLLAALNDPSCKDDLISLGILAAPEVPEASSVPDTASEASGTTETAS